MLTHRTYGKPPYGVAIFHGGPGAPGGMAPIARELAKEVPVFEPFQSALSIRGQLDEQYDLIAEHCAPPIILIGHSWGSLLAFMFTAQNPDMVKKLILIAAPSFDKKYAVNTTQKKLGRLSEGHRQEALELIENMRNNHNIESKVFQRYGQLMTYADSFEHIPHGDETIAYHADIMEKVWAEAEALREKDSLLLFADDITCPVTTIHGDYDSHPFEGINAPLSARLEKFRAFNLEKCGHYPWYEKHAKDKFFRILKDEIKNI